MAKRINIESVGLVDFPDDMSDDEIVAAIETDILKPKQSFTDRALSEGKRMVGAMMPQSSSPAVATQPGDTGLRSATLDNALNSTASPATADPYIDGVPLRRDAAMAMRNEIGSGQPLASTSVSAQAPALAGRVADQMRSTMGEVKQKIAEGSALLASDYRNENLSGLSQAIEKRYNYSPEDARYEADKILSAGRISDDFAKDAAKYSLADKANSPRSLTEKVTDTGLGVLGSLADLYAGGSSLVGAEDSRRWFSGMRKDFNAAKSDQLKARLQQFEGEEGFSDAANFILRNPELLANFVADSSATMLPGIGLAGLAGKGVAFAQGLAKAGKISAQAASVVAKILPTFAAAAGEGLTSAGITSSQIKDTVLETPDHVLKQHNSDYAKLRSEGVSEDVAKRELGSALATPASIKAGLSTALIAKLSGVAGAEAKAVQGALRSNLPALGKTFASNTLEEAAQNPLEELQQAIAVQQINGKNTFDLGKSVATGAMTGGPHAGVLHGVSMLQSATPEVKQHIARMITDPKIGDDMLAGRSLSSYSDAELAAHTKNAKLGHMAQAKITKELIRRNQEQAQQQLSTPPTETQPTQEVGAGDTVIPETDTVIPPTANMASDLSQLEAAPIDQNALLQGVTDATTDPSMDAAGSQGTGLDAGTSTGNTPPVQGVGNRRNADATTLASVPGAGVAVGTPNDNTTLGEQNGLQEKAQASQEITQLRNSLRAIQRPEAETVEEVTDFKPTGKGMTSAGHALLQAIKNMTGRKFTLVRGLGEPGVNVGQTTYLDVDAAPHQIAGVVFGHEIKHGLDNSKDKDAIQAREAFDSLFSLSGKEAARFRFEYGAALNEQEMQAFSGMDKTRQFRLMTPEEVSREYRADIFGNRFTDEKFWLRYFREVEAKNGATLGKRIGAKMMNTLNDVVERWLDNEAAPKQMRGQFDTDRYVIQTRGQLRKIRNAAAKAFAAYTGSPLSAELHRMKADNASFTKERAKKPSSDAGHKRHSTDGRYVGAPDWVGATSQQLTVLRQKLRKLAKEGESGRYWYEKSSKAVLDMFNGNKADAEKFIGLLAIYSQGTSVPANTAAAIKAWGQWKAGVKIDAGRFPESMGKKDEAWLNRGEDWGGIKVNNFYQDLMEEIDPSKVDHGHSTMDMWMALAFDYGDKVLDQGPKYTFAQREIQKLADELGWKPHQVQAAIWTAIKSRVESSEDLRNKQEIASGIRVLDPKEKAKGKDSWTTAKGREYEHFRLAHKLGMEHQFSSADIPKERREEFESRFAGKKIATEDVITELGEDFADALKKRYAQMSLETIPSTTVASIRGIHTAPMTQVAEYQEAMKKAFTGEDGRDIIDVEVGNLLSNEITGYSGWEGKTNIGLQRLLTVQTDSHGGTDKQTVVGKTRDMLNLSAAIHGIVWQQDGVAWHFPLYTGAINGLNGVEFKMGRSLTEQESDSLYKALQEELKHNESMPIPLADGTGFRVLHFPSEKFALQQEMKNTDKDLLGQSEADIKKLLQKSQLKKNEAFNKAVSRAVFAQPWASEVTDKPRFESDGELISNDWSNGNDEDYRGIIRGVVQSFGSRSWVGRSDIFKWIDDVLRPKADAVNKQFAKKYGWDSQPALFSTNRANAVGGEFDGRGLQGDVRESIHKGAVDAIGIHYSREQRDSLSSAAFGTGIQSEELERVKQAKDPRVKQRIYFYVNTGRGINPETGVGSHAHQAQLYNLYDLEADQKDLGVKYKDANELESAILDAGYKGTISQSRGIAVQIGPRTTKVKYLGVGKQSAPEAAKVEKSAYGKARQALVDNRSLPSGQMSGASWKRLMAALMPSMDVSHLNDETDYYRDQIVRKPKVGAGETAFSTFRAVDTESAEFKKWFGDSAVVDADGKPLVVYHGTREDFTQFDMGKTERLPGIWVTPSPKDASTYSTRGVVGGFVPDSNVMPLYVSLKNPRIITSREYFPSVFDAAYSDQNTDGVVVKNDDGSIEAIAVFDETKLKSATSNTGEFSPTNTDIRYSTSRKLSDDLAAQQVFLTEAANDAGYKSIDEFAAGNLDAFIKAAEEWRVSHPEEALFSTPRAQPWYFSALEDGLRTKVPKHLHTQPATQWQMWLKGNLNKLGAKADEYEWSGLADYLGTLGKEKVTAEQLADWVAENGVTVEEVVLGKADAYQRDDGNWVVRGLENQGYFSTKERAESYFTESELRDTGVAPKHASGKLVLPGGTDHREIVLTVPTIEPYNQSDSTHYGDVSGGRHVAWARVSTHIDTDGRRVLFVDEVQSQRNQHGRTKGFLAPDLHKEERNKIKAEMDELGDKARKARESGQLDESYEIGREIGKLDDRLRDIPTPYGVPKAPFVSTKDGKPVDSYISLVMKRLIAYARETGHEAISWTRGDQQADRYDLSKQISRIEAKDYAGRLTLSLYGNGDQYLSAQSFESYKDPDIADFVGKELADKIATDIGNHSLGLGDFKKDYRGLDLKVGGGWTASMYGDANGLNAKGAPSMIAQAAKKLGAKVESVALSKFAGKHSLVSNSGQLMHFDTREDAEAYAKKNNIPFTANGGGIQSDASADRAGQQPGFTLTDSMAGPMPLFSPRRTVAETSADFAEAAQAFSTARFPNNPQATWSIHDELNNKDRFLKATQDSLIDLKRVNQAIGQIESKWDTYKREMLYHGRVATQMKSFMQGEVRPLLHDLAMTGASQADFETFLWARHAPERNAQIASINPDMPDGGSGLTNAQAKDLMAGNDVTLPGGTIIKGVPQQHLRVFSRLGNQVDAMTKGTRDLLRANGIEPDETIDAWEAAYRNYVPLMRKDEDNGAAGQGQGYSVRGPSSKRAMGSQKEVQAILGNVMRARENAIVRSEKNLILQSLYGEVLKNPNQDFWAAIRVDSNLFVKYDVLGTEIKNAQDKLDNLMAQGVSVNDPQVMMLDQVIGAKTTERNNLIPLMKKSSAKLLAELTSMGLDPADAQNIADMPVERYINASGDVAYRPRKVMLQDTNIITLRVNGEDRYVMFNEDNERATSLARALKKLDASDMGLLWKTVAPFTRWFASVNTQFNPIFGAVNLTRDLGGMALNLSTTPIAHRKWDVMKRVPKMLKGIYSDLRNERKTGQSATSPTAQLFKQFENDGGRTGYRDMFATSQKRTSAALREAGIIDHQNKLLDGADKIWHATKGKKVVEDIIGGWLSDYNDAMENATRLATYDVALDELTSKGMSMENARIEAATIAKNITVNFNKKGDIGAQAGAAYAFFNAAVQGTARIAETMAGPAGKKILGGGLLLGMANAFLLAAMGFDDDDIPEYIRERNLIIPIGGKKFVTVPMPLGYHAIPNAGRNAMEVMLGRKTPFDAFIGTVMATLEAFNPIGSSSSFQQMISPTIADPFVALGENRDWSGKMIAKERRGRSDPTPGHLMAKDTATTVGKHLAQAINWMMGGDQYVKGRYSPTPDQIDYLAGQVGGGVWRELSKLEQSVTSKATGEDLPPHKVPLIGRFYGNAEGKTGESQRFYSNIDRMERHEASIKGRYEDGDAAGAKKYLEENPDAKLYDMSNKVQTTITKLNKLKRQAKEEGNKARVKSYEDMITETMKDFNMRVSKVKKAA